VRIAVRRRPVDGDEHRLGIELSWRHGIERRFRKHGIESPVGFYSGGLRIER
jgi:hypothetical protein